MLLSLINSHTEEIIFASFAASVIVFSTLAILSNDSRTSIINLLAASITLAAMITLISSNIVAITIAIIYTSMCSLLLIISGVKKPKRNYKKSYIVMVISVFCIVVSFIYKNLESVYLAEEATSEHYDGIAGITLVMSVLFISAIAGISFMLSTLRKPT